ncbi:MAG: DUF2797 domain-containing protein [Flavobacteriales bacterium]|nr:DUF2797 domain-containing protein [Flavobacteriales bacterium]
MQESTSTKFQGEANLRKMYAELDVQGQVQYQFTSADILEKNSSLPMNAWIGLPIRLEYTGTIHCTVSGSRIRKTYGDGMGFKAFSESPFGVESILRPELSRIHEGIALRDYDWEMAHHMQPHVTYLSFTSGIKVGVTRATQLPVRWIDQGASAAIILCRTPYRGLAGEIEVDLKSEFSDRTQWRKMLTSGAGDPHPEGLLEAKEQAIEVLDPAFENFIDEDHTVTRFAYPHEKWPEKVTSCRLDKQPVFEGRLAAIKGQYLILESGSVLNVRNHAGYRVRWSVG